MGIIPSMRLTSSIRNQCSRSGVPQRSCWLAGNDKNRTECSRSGYLRRSCKLADNDKISFNKERRMTLRCCSRSLYIMVLRSWDSLFCSYFCRISMVPMGVQNKKLHPSFHWNVAFNLEAPPRLELGVADLQSAALPLGYGAICSPG